MTFKCWTNIYIQEQPHNLSVHDFLVLLTTDIYDWGHV